jgi:nitroimidazol reductase NimA-like FMN-containing flavoprotein (pyridoxamine 5'-phosphate oxidase superfamily)
MVTSRPMSPDAMERLLAGERIVRVAFAAPGETYILPLGYLWHDGAFYLLTARGRKTRLAAINPRVGFQVDDSATAGVWGWRSVTGEGQWEAVAGAAEAALLLPRLFARFPETPTAVWRRVATSLVRGDTLLVRIRPLAMSGVEQDGPAVQ